MSINKQIPVLLPFVLLSFAYGIVFLLVQGDFKIEQAQFIGAMSFLFICLLLEIIFPFRKDWSFWKDEQSINDIILYIFNTLFLIKAMSIITYIKLKLHFGTESYWPEKLPFLLQLLLSFIIFDFFYYWFHRLSHTIKTVWIFHAVHHSSSKMHFLKGNRSNLFLDALPYLFLTVFPLAFLNPPKEVFIMMSYTLTIFSFLVHSNINMSFPRWWESFFVSPKIHYMHHNIKVDNTIGYNFGTLILLWDKVFKTYAHYEEPEKLNVGIHGNPVNRSVFWQILYPFKK